MDFDSYFDCSKNDKGYYNKYLNLDIYQKMIMMYLYYLYCCLVNLKTYHVHDDNRNNLFLKKDYYNENENHVWLN